MTADCWLKVSRIKKSIQNNSVFSVSLQGDWLIDPVAVIDYFNLSPAFHMYEINKIIREWQKNYRTITDDQQLRWGAFL